jgi:hypothetical protein
MDPATFFTELKRRKVYMVAVAYAIVAWLLIQAASILFPDFQSASVGDESICHRSDSPCFQSRAIRDSRIATSTNKLVWAR